jgi:catechol 2,3-dioxygenase-like lactoylglutathione lyase family enzyme
MSGTDRYETRRRELREKFLQEPVAGPVSTAGVDHLALICSDIEQTIRFYTEIVDMRLVRIVTNRDDPTSTHIFPDMGGGNLLAFFDFPEHGDAPVTRGIGAMHHVALKADSDRYRAIIGKLKAQDVPHSIHGTEQAGSVYFRDPDNILLEIKSAG